MLRAFASAVLGLTLLVVPRPAAAEDEREKARPWYGQQTLAVDAAGSGLLLLALGTNGGTENKMPVTLTGVALVPLSLGAPIVHGAHERWGVAAGSLALRVGAGFTFGYLGALVGGGGSGETFDAFDTTSRSDRDKRKLRGFVGGVALAVLLAAPIDAFLFARDNPKKKKTEPAVETGRLVPVIDVAPGGGFAGVAGTF